MILIKVTGGPGNQLFQYAFGRNLALIYKTDLYLDLSEFEIKKHRVFILNKFKIRAKIATKKLLKSFLKFSYYLPYDLRPQCHKLLPSFFPNIFYENKYTFDKNNFVNKNDSYLIGFWQSEKYFANIRDKLLNEISLKHNLSAKSKEVLKQIRKTESVSINVRRGDFLSNPQINKRHGVISKDYFEKAIVLMSQKVKNPHYFLFSDDIEWVKDNIKPSHATYVDFNFPKSTEEDLLLGSYCKHNILTNSTYSWWVGWLNANPKKIVIAPSKWFNQLNYDFSDLFPEEWQILDI